MTRGTKSRSTALCACLAALALIAAPSAMAAGPAALEEYVLALPGVEKKDVQGSAPIVEQAEQAGPVGVVGEQKDDFTRLGAVSAAMLTPAGAGLAVLVLAGTVLALRRRGGRT